MVKRTGTGARTAPVGALRALAGRIDAANDAIGRAVAWLLLLQVALLAIQVPLRLSPSGTYSTMANDIGQLTHATVFMVGIAYAMRWDQHARVDIVYRGLSARRQAWVNLLGHLLFTLPWLAVLALYSAPVVANSWADLEVFVDSWAPGYFLLKSMLLVLALLLGLQALAAISRALSVLLETAPESRRARAL